MADAIVRNVTHEVGRYWVQSRSQPDQEHLCDLLYFDGNGKCSCQNFQFTCEPKLVRGAKPDKTLRCWHLRLAREVFLQDVLTVMARKEKDGAKPKRTEYQLKR